MINYLDDNNDPGDDDSSEDEIISKSQQKREAQAAHKLGEDLFKLSPAALKKIELPENLSKALEEAHKIKKQGGLKRQLQFIAKIMRKLDLESIQKEYQKVVNHYGKDIKQLHRLEEWRDRLLAEGDSALEELLTEAPTTDRQHLRQLIRQSHKETKLNKPPKSAREIFKYLKTLFG